MVLTTNLPGTHIYTTGGKENEENYFNDLDWVRDNRPDWLYSHYTGYHYPTHFTARCPKYGSSSTYSSTCCGM
jgi:hypothetical protein